MANIVVVQIEGIKPLLQHRYYSADEPEPKTNIRTGRPAYELEAEKAAYRDADGKLCQPGDHIHASMVKAAANFKIPGKRGKSYKDLIQTSVDVCPDLIPHIFQEYEIDSRGVVVQRSRIIRYRPRLNKWALKFELHIIDEQLDVSVVRQILDYAGRCVGIGDYRPKFGRFVVTEWKEVGQG